jgi:two-component system cell cycle response regulator DivK
MKGKVLIVEDDPITKRFYDFVFKHSDMEIIQTENFEEILNILKNENIRVVVLDINLRNTSKDGKLISGITLSQMIKETPEFGNPKVILVSAYKLYPGDGYLIESKADDYILKPITDFNLFLEKVRKLFIDE